MFIQIIINYIQRPENGLFLTFDFSLVSDDVKGKRSFMIAQFDLGTEIGTPNKWHFQ